MLELLFHTLLVTVRANFRRFELLPGVHNSSVYISKIFTPSCRFVTTATVEAGDRPKVVDMVGRLDELDDTGLRTVAVPCLDPELRDVERLGL